MNFKDRFEKGLRGEYQGLDNGFTKLNNYVFGTQKSCYILLGGQSGTYKSTFADFWTLKTLESAEKLNIPLDLFYYSFEIDKESKYANWMSNIIFNKYNEVIRPEIIKCLGGLRPNIHQKSLILKETDYLEHLMSKIKWRFDADNPTGIFHELWEYAENNGKIIYEDYESKEGPKKRIVEYKVNDPTRMCFIVLDHLARLKRERSFQLKDNIDKFSDYCIILRNLFKLSFLIIQQFNQGLINSYLN